MQSTMLGEAEYTGFVSISLCGKIFDLHGKIGKQSRREILKFNFDVKDSILNVVPPFV